MKRIVVLLLCFSALAAETNAQSIFAPTKIQNAARIQRVYLWDRPVTDSLTYQGILPGNMQPVTMFSHDGKTSYYTLPSNKQYKEMQEWFDSLRTGDRIVGAEYIVSYLDKFSWVRPGKIRKIKDAATKMTVSAFNNSAKYVILSISPRPVYGVRNPDNGAIMLDIPPLTEQQKAEIKDTLVKKTETPPAVRKTMPTVIPEKPKEKPVPVVEEKKVPATKGRNFTGNG